MQHYTTARSARHCEVITVLKYYISSALHSTCHSKWTDRTVDKCVPLKRVSNKRISVRNSFCLWNTEDGISGHIKAADTSACKRFSVLAPVWIPKLSQVVVSFSSYFLLLSRITCTAEIHIVIVQHDWYQFEGPTAWLLPISFRSLNTVTLPGAASARPAAMRPFTKSPLTLFITLQHT